MDSSPEHVAVREREHLEESEHARRLCEFVMAVMPLDVIYLVVRALYGVGQKIGDSWHVIASRPHGVDIGMLKKAQTFAADIGLHGRADLAMSQPVFGGI
ncbi:MAG: hypothetical protein ABSG69_11320 [Candidatus Acidiferrum sp.]